MVDHYSEIKDGIVVNVVLASPEIATERGYISGGNIGDSWDGQNFISPTPEPTPGPILDPASQLINALIQKGIITEEDLKGK